jgi:hypothetical protein
VTSGTFGAADTGKEFDSGLVESTALISQGKIFDAAETIAIIPNKITLI